MANSFLDLAEDVLKKARGPLMSQQIWEQAESSGIAARLGTKLKKPWHSLAIRLYADVRVNPNSKFVKIGKRQARFFLKSREEEIPADIIERIDIEEAKKPVKV